MSFRVQLDAYHGPLDLLLHLVRKQELEIAVLPLARVTEQFIAYVAVLEQLDIDSIGEFLDVAAALVEIKSKIVLPRAEEDAEPEEAIDDPQDDLVHRLLEFKQYRDAASVIEERGVEWRRRYARVAPDLPAKETTPADQQIVQVELWDLVCAFGRVMQEKIEPPAATIPYDDTPVHVFMRRVYDRLTREREVLFGDLFDGQVHKSTLIATFLAVLELVRHGHALAEQSKQWGDLLLQPGENPLPDDPSRVVSIAAETTGE